MLPPLWPEVVAPDKGPALDQIVIANVDQALKPCKAIRPSMGNQLPNWK